MQRPGETMTSPGEGYQLWCHQTSGVFYAVRLVDQAIRGACALTTAAALARRHSLEPLDFLPAAGARLAQERQQFAVIEEW
jgi:hypothetical protein